MHYFHLKLDIDIYFWNPECYAVDFYRPDICSILQLFNSIYSTHEAFCTGRLTAPLPLPLFFKLIPFSLKILFNISNSLSCTS